MHTTFDLCQMIHVTWTVWHGPFNPFIVIHRFMWHSRKLLRSNKPQKAYRKCGPSGMRSRKVHIELSRINVTPVTFTTHLWHEVAYFFSNLNPKAPILKELYNIKLDVSINGFGHWILFPCWKVQIEILLIEIVLCNTKHVGINCTVQFWKTHIMAHSKLN